MNYYDLDGKGVVKRARYWWRVCLMVLFLGGILNMLNIMNYLHLSQHEDEKIFSQPTSSTNDPITIEIVLAYCSSPLTWVEKDVIQDTLKTFPLASFHFTIMSKCGKEQMIPDFRKIEAVKSVEIVSIDNVGGCDYAYAKFLNDYYIQSRQTKDLFNKDSESSTSNNVIIFLKDTPRTKHNFHKEVIFSSYRSIPEMIQISSEKTDFVCGLGIKPEFSEYHDINTLHKFHRFKYVRRGDTKVVSSGRDFNPHGYTNLEDFHSKALQWTFPRKDYTRVCYGGTFAVPYSRLQSLVQDQNFNRVIKSIESAVNEGKMSVTEHYVERTWAGLLSKPLTDEESSSLQSTVTGIITNLAIGTYGTLFLGADKSSYPSNLFHANLIPPRMVH